MENTAVTYHKQITWQGEHSTEILFSTEWKNLDKKRLDKIG